MDAINGSRLGDREGFHGRDAAMDDAVDVKQVQYLSATYLTSFILADLGRQAACSGSQSVMWEVRCRGEGWEFVDGSGRSIATSSSSIESGRAWASSSDRLAPSLKFEVTCS